MTGINLGSIAGYPPTNKPIKTTGVTIYHFDNGKVCGHHQVFDRTGGNETAWFYTGVIKREGLQQSVPNIPYLSSREFV